MTVNTNDGVVPGSFRDPNGFLFLDNGELYRQINQDYQADYQALNESGLYEKLIAKGLLIPHTESNTAPHVSDGAYKVVKPEVVPFISYPYEWSFSQLQDAALTTLQIQHIAIEHGMTLKDASAYNIQFHHGKPVFIDTLSFEKWMDGSPWTAYRQFCQHFLNPLALMSYTDVRLSQLLRVFIDGVPMDLASRLLPKRTRMQWSLLAHVHIHASTQRRYASKGESGSKKPKISKTGLLGLIGSLEKAVKRLTWNPKGTEWADYYECTNYSETALSRKREIVAEFLDVLKPNSVWDMGANLGLFSRVAAEKGIPVLSFDIDPAAVEKNYRYCRSNNEPEILPLVMDLTNPSAAIGWSHTERMSLEQRGPADAVLALALIHHLAISNNVPLDHVAKHFFGIGKSLVIEFVPKEDSQVRHLLATREDVFPGYHQQGFERAFGRYFEIIESRPVSESARFLYCMKRK